jgi:hypothetical protein
MEKFPEKSNECKKAEQLLPICMSFCALIVGFGLVPRFAAKFQDLS